MIILPDFRTKLWQQNNRSDIIGTLWSSLNLNLTEQLGKTKVSPRMVITTTTSDDTYFHCPVAFREYAGDLYTVGGISSNSPSGYIFKATNGLLRTKFVQVNVGGNPNGFDSDGSDLEIFNAKLYATDYSGGSVWKFNGTTWTSASSITTGSNPHKLLNFTRLNRLYVQKSNNQIVSLDSTDTYASSGAYTLSLANTDVVITSMIQTSDLIWILTVNLYNNQGFVYTWDGATADTVTDVIPLDSRGALAGIIKDGIPFIIDTDGKLMYHNGQAFIMAPNGRLPIRQAKYLKNPNSSVNNRWIHPNGITLVDGRINILINNENYDNSATIQESLPSGIWEYDQDIGWYHKSALTQYNQNGTATISDYGQNRISRAGALFNVKKDDNTSSSFVGTLIAGADYFIDNTTSTSASFTNDSLDLIQKYGYLVTNKILSTNSAVQNAWEKVFMRIRPLLNSTDKIVVKYRSDDSVATEVDITWINYNSFTTTTDISSYWTSGIGGEVEITKGAGSGLCSHITSIVNNSGTFTVTLDEQYPNVSGTGKARFQTWKKLDSFNTRNISLVQFGSMGSFPWVQIKVCLLYTGNNEVIDLLVQNGNFQ